MSIRQFQAQRMHAPRDFQCIENNPICVKLGREGQTCLLFSGQHPELKLIAIERTREKFVAMQKQHQLEGQTNLTPIHADALPWVVHALYPAGTTVFILYPNEPHNPAALVKYAFFEFLISRLQQMAALH
jgi:tRNA G46 methylase TrmB